MTMFACKGTSLYMSIALALLVPTPTSAAASRMTAGGTAYAFVLGRGFLSSKEANMIGWATLSRSFGDAIPLHIAVHSGGSDRMVVTAQSNEVFESRDGGRNWKPFGQPQ